VGPHHALRLGGHPDEPGRWLEELHHDRLPNVEENLLLAFKDPVYDPGNAHSVPWQGGITGIAYNPS
jgi:spermidine/putrescine-binding protein